MTVLHDIQKKLKVGKENRNEFGKYNYRNASDIIEAVKPLLPEGFCVLLYDDLVMIGDRFYVKATACLTNHKETYTTTAFAREELTKKGMDASQITGSASTYARKYALNGLFAIDDTKDADSMDNTKEVEEKISGEKILEINRLITETGSDVTKLLEVIGAATIADMTESHAKRAIELLEVKKARNAKNG